jgi:ABC-type branched-subunit amino acid transport system ATPase component
MSAARPHEVARLGVGYVPEGRGIFPNLSVRENLVMAARAGRGQQQGIGLGDQSRQIVAAGGPRGRAG